MKKFFNKKCLILNSFPSSFGDGFDNSRIYKIIHKLYNNRCLIHSYLHTTTMDCLYWHFTEQKYVDRFFTIRNIKELYDKLNYIPDNFYDFILIEHLGAEDDEYIKLFNHLKIKFPFAEIFFYSDYIANQIQQKTIRKLLYEKFNTDCLDDNYLNIYKNQIDEIFNYGTLPKNVVLFPFSTRPLASFGVHGIKKFCEYYNNIGYNVFIGGEILDPYSQSEYGKSFFSKTIKDIREMNLGENVIDIMGLNMSKTIELCNKMDLVVMSPTGINLIAFEGYIKTKTIILQYGDSQIMHGVSQPYFKRKIKNEEPVYWKFINSVCSCYPCQHSMNEKAISCRNEKNAKCLNEEFNPENLLNEENLLSS